MAKLNPTTLRRIRKKLDLSQDDLAAKSKIPKSTIYRIEAGKTNRTNARVIEALAKALKVEVEALTATEVEAETADTKNKGLFKTKFVNQISTHSRNALHLVAMRYDVQEATIVEFAPLLFHIVASESLGQRREHLAELRSARAAIGSLGRNFSHLAGRLVCDDNAESLDSLEEQSIAARDLRSDLIDMVKADAEPRSQFYNADESNPFVAHIRTRLVAMQAEGCNDQMDRWSLQYGPDYAICLDEAHAYFGGDDEAANALVRGVFSVSDIPKDLRGEDKVRERAQWAREKEDAQVNDLLESIGMGEIS